MANLNIAPANTYDTAPNGLSIQNANAMRRAWDKGALIGEEEGDSMQQFEGGETAPIWVDKDSGKGNGKKKTFTTTSGYYGEGQYGAGLFEGPDDYEKDDINSFDLEYDIIRNASSRDVRGDELSGLKDELKNMVPVKLGEWLGRTKDHQIKGAMVLKLPSENRICAGNKTINTLGSNDILSYDDIIYGGAAMKPLGGQPASMRKEGMNTIQSHLFIPSEQAATSLRLDNAYQLALHTADTRGDTNRFFKGGYPHIDGHVIAPHNALNHAGKGAVGSFLAPEAFLGVALTSNNTVQRIVSGGGFDNFDGGLTGASKKPLWMKFFPGHAFRFVDTGFFTASTGPHFALVYNTSGANAGKWGAILYTTGNNGNSITAVEHLAAASGAFGKTTLTGSAITWNGALNTDQWDTGALIIPCNAKGVPFAHTMILGAGAICRAYGVERARRDVEVDNGAFIHRTFIRSSFGQTFRKDRKGRVPAAMLLTTAIKRAGITLPDVV